MVTSTLSPSLTTRGILPTFEGGGGMGGTLGTWFGRWRWRWEVVGSR